MGFIRFRRLDPWPPRGNSQPARVPGWRPLHFAACRIVDATRPSASTSCAPLGVGFDPPGYFDDDDRPKSLTPSGTA